ncbi:MAG: fatty acid desaturase family protein [Gammaproteobacteria bacterium]
MPGLFRYRDALRPNLFALSYVMAAYVSGLALILVKPLWLNLTGMLLLAHAMVIAAYLVHECAHNSIFRKNRYHRWLAEVLLWICGASYSDYNDIRHKHVRHHVDRADVVSFDYRVSIRQYPKLLKLIQGLEWMYIPAVEIVMHILVIILPFIKQQRKNRRSRILGVVLLRFLFFFWLASISLKILVFYPFAYMLFLIIMRFMDVHQHTYDLFETLDLVSSEKNKIFDRIFEQRNTYSNLLSDKYAWLNLLVLNFSYHNAHHQQPGRPWHHLASLHKELYGENTEQVLSFKALLKSYHRYRVVRISNADEINMAVKPDVEKFIGVDGVSFLTAH